MTLSEFNEYQEKKAKRKVLHDCPGRSHLGDCISSSSSLCVCACVHACVRACVRACVCIFTFCFGVKMQ